ncbi:R2-like ligand-binding oxidase [Bacillus sp. T33-2]|uniref:R2-like ligand-binding oxidase n=1 Tax=Bacillus sp. T33-2 TaxID=2054168 RepID=UPI000C793C71|nr:R2-like ligand-binding oxidase [Bacillus sp. T33-2]PLR96372.1 ribonucleotide-diphosphate reductase subunit beta [Bacillus sp. T33-2]
MKGLKQVHEQFQSSTDKLLDWNHPMYKLYEKAKKFGGWNPGDIDFSVDRANIAKASPKEREMVAQLVALFGAGEEAVTLDFLPVLYTMGNEGRLEDTIYLTTFLYEEAKHTEFFARWRQEVGMTEDLSKFHTDNYKKIFYEKLPQAMNALYTDDSPAAQVRALTTYHMVVEGMLAESGYHSFRLAFEASGMLPGIIQGIINLSRDEGRHIGFGTYSLRRLIAADPALYDVFSATMDDLLPYAIGLINDTISITEGQDVYGIDWSIMTDYAIKQYNARESSIARAKQDFDAYSDIEEEVAAAE